MQHLVFNLGNLHSEVVTPQIASQNTTKFHSRVIFFFSRPKKFPPTIPEISSSIYLYFTFLARYKKK